jgi:hypothetical protein
MKRLIQLFGTTVFLLLIVIQIKAATQPDNVVPEGVSLNGVNQYITVENSKYLNPELITIETWVKVNGFESVKAPNDHSWQFIVFKKNRLHFFNEGATLYLDDIGRRFAASVSSDLGDQKCIATNFNFIQQDRWYHLAMTADKNMLCLYVDGKLMNSIATNFNLNFDNEPLFIGGREYRELTSDVDNIFEGKFNGCVDEVRVWSAVHSQEEIKSMMYTRLVGNESNLMLYLPFDPAKDQFTDKGLYHHRVTFHDTQYTSFQKQTFETEANEALAGIFDFGLNVTPNPATSDATVNFNIPTEGLVSVKIYNSIGAEVIDICNQTLPKGKYTFPFHIDGNKDHSDAYFCMLYFGTLKETAKFVVLK